MRNPARRSFFLSLIAGALTVVTVMPMFVVFVLSLNSGRYAFFPPHNPTLDGYRIILTDWTWRRAISETLLISAAAGLIAGGCGACLAWAQWRSQASLHATQILAVVVPSLLPPLVVALGFYLAFARLGWVPTRAVLIVAHATVSVSWSYLLSTLAFDRIDRQFLIVARSLGATEPQILLRVIVPLVFPSFLGVVIFCGILAANDVVLNVFLGSSQVDTLSRHVWMGLRFELSPETAAAAIVAGVVTVALVSVTATVVQRSLSVYSRS